MNNKKDLRVIKTRNALFNSLITLLKGKSFEELKVSDICENALVNRSTFYSHYQDKYELVMDFINNMENNISKELEKNNNIFNTKEYYIEMIKLIMNYIDDNKEIYNGILNNNKNSIFFDIISNSIEKDIEYRIKNNTKINNINTDFVTRFYVGAVSSIVIDWIQNKLKYSKEDVIKYLDILIPSNIN